MIERGIQAVEGQSRTVKSAIEARLGERIPSDHDVIPWLVEYAAVPLNRCHVEEGGKNKQRKARHH